MKNFVCYIFNSGVATFLHMLAMRQGFYMEFNEPFCLRKKGEHKFVFEVILIIRILFIPCAYIIV